MIDTLPGSAMNKYLALLSLTALVLGCKKNEDNYDEYHEDPPALAKLIEGPRPTTTKDDLARIYFWQMRPVKEKPTVEDKETYTVMMTMLTDGSGLEVVKDTSLWSLQNKQPMITKDGKYLIHIDNKAYQDKEKSEKVQVVVARNLQTGVNDTLQGRRGDLGTEEFLPTTVYDYSRKFGDGRPLPRKNLGRWIDETKYLDYDVKTQTLTIESHPFMFMRIPLFKKEWSFLKFPSDYHYPAFLLSNGNITVYHKDTAEMYRENNLHGNSNQPFVVAGQRNANGKYFDVAGKLNWLEGNLTSNLDRSKLLMWAETPTETGRDSVLAWVGPNGELLKSVKWPTDLLYRSLDLSPSGQYLYFSRFVWESENKFSLYCRLNWDTLFSQAQWTKEDLAKHSQIVLSSQNLGQMSLYKLGEWVVPVEAKIK
jgi:hypothetical protein